jgi:DNA topoisomerase-1
VFSIGLNRAVTVLAEKAAKGPGGRGRGTPAALKELGDHPDGGSVTVRDGKYGPYVNWGKVNATLPKGMDPQSVTMEQAMALIIEKGGKASSSKSKPKKAAAAKADGETKTKTAAKKAPAKKAPAKKAAPKAKKTDT